MDDLIERLRDERRAWSFTNTKADRHDAIARIAALEADKARMMGLVKEAGEALEVCIWQCEGCATEHYGGDHELFGMPQYITDARTTLAKIKETPDA